MATRVRFVVALLSLACCSTTVAGQFSASFWETWGHYMQLASTKPIDWNATIGLRDSGQVQESCYDQSVQLHTDMTTGQSYAIQMLDSSGKLNPTALFEGRYDDFGSFKGCRDRVKYAPDIPADMKPMYCILGWSGIAPELTGGAQSFTQGLCVPNTCSDLEVGLLANTGLLGTKPMPSWTVVGFLCQREEVYTSFDTGAIVALSFIAIILLMLLIGTLFEFIINVSYTEEKVKSITKSKTGRFFLSFSVYSNTKKVFNTYQPPGQLPALHGIRVISTLWIIYGHTDFFADNTLTTNKRQKDEWYSSEWWYFIRGSMDMAVDTFLLLSALLVSYLFMKQLKKNGGSFTGKDLLLHYLHRYWRLTPVYAFLIMIFACLMVYMGTGPVWASPINLATGNMKACQTWMWTNLLYINNWFNGEQECFGWSWYLGVDMQLYVIAPGLLVLLYKKPKLGVGLVTFFLILSMFLTGILYHFFVIVPSGSYYATVYKFTFTRMGPYMVGLLMGYILFTTDRKVPNTGSTKALMLLGWFGATAVAVLFVGAPGWIGTPFSIWGQPAWRAFDRTMFSCAVAWVVFACCVGYGGIITEFLSWSGWVPLSRLTYTAYLVHPIIMHVYTMSLKTPLFYSATNWWFYFIAYSFMAFLCGFVASIMVEFPFFGLEKLIFPQRRGRDSSKASNNVTSGAHDNQALELGETSQPVDDRAAKSNGQMAITNDENDKIPGQANGQWSVSISANQETFDQKL